MTCIFRGFRERLPQGQRYKTLSIEFQVLMRPAPRFSLTFFVLPVDCPPWFNSAVRSVADHRRGGPLRKLEKKEATEYYICTIEVPILCITDRSLISRQSSQSTPRLVTPWLIEVSFAYHVRHQHAPAGSGETVRARILSASDARCGMRAIPRTKVFHLSWDVGFNYDTYLLRIYVQNSCTYRSWTS